MLKDSKKLIGFSPFEDGGNQYTSNMKKILSEMGEVVVVPKIKELITLKISRKYDLIVLSWSDNDFVNSVGNIVWKNIAKKFILSILYRILSEKTIFVRHNVVPHATNHKNHKIVRKFIDFYEKTFDVIWVHSGHFVGKSRYYIPHPLYERYSFDALPDDISIKNKDYYVVFGRILAYKNIDALLTGLPNNVNLVVCGPVGDDGYFDKLKSIAGSNVQFYPNFLSEGAAQNLVSGAKALIVCSKEEDMIVSGSVVFAISLNVPVVTCQSAYAKWLLQENPAAAIMNFDSIGDLHAALENNFIKTAENSKVDIRPQFDGISIKKFIRVSLAGKTPD